MTHKYFLNKKRIGFGIIVFVTFSIISFWFINEPEIFIRNFFGRKRPIQIIGFLGLTSSLLNLFSLVTLLFRSKEAFVISDCYLIDNTKFESVGKIYFHEIHKVKRIKKNNLEIVLKEPVFKSKRLNILKKILLVLNNWNYKNSILVSSALLLNCEIEDLEKAISGARKRYKPSDCLDAE